jgi:hypothetical protein
MANGFHLTNQNARELTNTVNNFYIELPSQYCNNVGQLVSLFAWHKSHQIAAESLQAASGSRYLFSILYVSPNIAESVQAAAAQCKMPLNWKGILQIQYAISTLHCAPSFNRKL